MPIRTALLLATGALAAAVLPGCGDSETNDAARTTTSTTSTTASSDDTSVQGLDEACIDTIVEYFNNTLDLTRLTDPAYVEEVTAALGDCDPAGLSQEQAAEISGRLDADVVAAISGGAPPPEDPAATTTPSSTP